MTDEWKTLKSETIDTGSNNFIEISLKQPPESELTLIGISKGWYTQDKKKKYKANILFSSDIRDEIVNKLKEIDK